MPGSVADRLSGRYALWLARGIAGACLLVSALVLAGWVLSIPSLTTLGRDWTPMVVSTALVVLSGGVAILHLSRSVPPRWRLVRALGLLITAGGGATLVNFIVLWLTGALLFETGPAWRMAPQTALAATLLGGALLVMGRSQRGDRVSEGMLAAALVIVLVMVASFAFGAAPKSDLMGRVNMSPITGLGLLGVVATLLFLVPGSLTARVIGGNGPGSRLARPWFAVVLIVPVVLGWLRLEAELRRLIGMEYGVALMIVGTGTTSLLAIFAFAARVNRYDERQRRDQEARQFLASASEVLSESLDLRVTLARVADLCVPSLADWCTVALRRAEGSLEVVSVVHQDPAKVEWAKEYQRRFPPDVNAPSGAGAVVRTGQPEFHPEIPDALLARAANDPEQLEVLRGLGLSSALSVPMAASGRTVGVLTLATSGTERRLSRDDLAAAQQLADRCGAAIERARLFTELRTLTEELEHRVADRTAELAVTNRELESFAYSVSHDLRTPLRALDGFSQAVLEDYGDRLDDTGRDYLNRIRRGSQRMGDLIDAMLELSRVTRSELRREQVDLSAVATDVLRGLREQDPARSVDATVQPGMTVAGDPRLLRAMLQNLLGNAWKFTAKRPDARIEFTVERDNGKPEPVFVVRDNGAGFDMAHASKLFGAFQRLHTVREFEGTGVGLATVQRIVHRHAGEIWARGVPGEGASFLFTLR